MPPSFQPHLSCPLPDIHSNHGSPEDSLRTIMTLHSPRQPFLTPIHYCSFSSPQACSSTACLILEPLSACPCRPQNSFRCWLNPGFRQRVLLSQSTLVDVTLTVEKALQSTLCLLEPGCPGELPFPPNPFCLVSRERSRHISNVALTQW